jgi:hypothetical protein
MGESLTQESKHRWLDAKTQTQSQNQRTKSPGTLPHRARNKINGGRNLDACLTREKKPSHKRKLLKAQIYEHTTREMTNGDGPHGKHNFYSIKIKRDQLHHGGHRPPSLI